MKKLVIVMLAGAGLLAFARRSAGHGKHQHKRVPAPITPPPNGRSIDPGIVVHSPFNGDPGMVVHSPFNGDPGIVRGPKATPASQADQPAADQHDLV
ncbi:MAG: hypothetical protein H0X37_20370 [Herpetosiphonaceae bacterium]|nr:hypothetical protein [Herpetosiphonaceae bacterium]